MSTRLVLLRHAESEWNAAGVFQGQGGVGLSPRGHRQAEAVARAIADRFHDVTRLVRSDLQRCAQTAAPVVALLGVPELADERWREVDVGSWTGRPWAEVEATDPNGLDAWRQLRDTPGSDRERFGDFLARLRAALADAVESAEGTVVVVTHGGCIRSLLADLLGLADARLLGRAENGALTLMELDGARRRLVRFNDDAHLLGVAV